MSKKNLIAGQSGGPTAAINSSLYGVVSEALKHTAEEEWKEYSKDIIIQGRGGTGYRPVFRYVKEQQEKKEIRRLKALIYFTDGDGIYPGSRPDYETAFVFLHKTEKMELVGFLQAFRKLDVAYSAVLFVVCPAASCDVSTFDTLDRQHVQFTAHHGFSF